MLLNTILLDGAQQPQGGGGMSMLIMIVLMIVIFYFFMIRPQNKKQKKLREERAKLDKGSKVVTSGGIYGRIREVRENTFIVEVADGVKITVDKNCIYPAADVDDAVAASQQQK